MSPNYGMHDDTKIEDSMLYDRYGFNDLIISNTLVIFGVSTVFHRFLPNSLNRTTVRIVNINMGLTDLFVVF